MKQQSGFTLIELIAVIVILGILAATALPKFSALSADARVAKIKGVAAAVHDAASMAHGQYLAEQIASNVAITLEDGTSVGMANGYPTAATTGIEAAIDTADGYTWATAGSGVQASISGFSNCLIEYDAAVGSAVPVIVTTSAVTANCE